MINTTIIQDAAEQQWLRFSEPCEVVAAGHIKDVIPKLQRIETRVNEERLYAVGFISYEASPAFDPSLRVRPSASFPLLWFALYPEAEKISLPPPPDKIVHTPAHWTPSVTKAAYQQAIARIKKYIALGETYQVNYTFRLHAPFSGDAWEFFLELMRVQETRYAAYIDTGRFAICSASPELFFNWDGHELTLRPMKGTASRGMTLSEDKSQAEWLYHSVKNRAENVMIVDMIRNDAGRIAETGSVRVPGLFNIEKYPTVWQMTSGVTARTEASLCDMMTALFPCASITGAPKPSTMKIIADLETTPRHVYTGCIGFIAPNRRAQFNIGIRTVMIDRKTEQAEYGVGGGIVWDSDTKDEYEECRIKASLLSEKRPDFSLLETLLWEHGSGYFLLDRHIRRLKDSAEYFDFSVTEDRIREKLGEVTDSFSRDMFYKVRLLVSRDGSADCESVPVELTQSGPVRVKLSSSAIHSGDPFLYHKTTYRQVYETAMKNCPDCDDVILFNERGEVTEATIANIVVECNGKRMTPPVRCGLLGGTFRSWLLDQGEVEEGVVTIDMLRRSERIYLINSVRKWREAFLQ